MSYSKKILAINALGFSLLLADRLAKRAVTYSFRPGQNNFFLALHRNYGLAFGLPFGSAAALLAIMVLVLLVIASLLADAYRRQDARLVLPLTLVILGTASNLTDRLTCGYVIDYINIPFFTVFNLADAAITAGLVLWATRIIRD